MQPSRIEAVTQAVFEKKGLGVVVVSIGRVKRCCAIFQHHLPAAGDCVTARPGDSNGGLCGSAQAQPVSRALLVTCERQSLSSSTLSHACELRGLSSVEVVLSMPVSWQYQLAWNTQSPVTGTPGASAAQSVAGLLSGNGSYMYSGCFCALLNFPPACELQLMLERVYVRRRHTLRGSQGDAYAVPDIYLHTQSCLAVTTRRSCSSCTCPLSEAASWTPKRQQNMACRNILLVRLSL
jgi:hypothetical protein